MKKFFIDNIHLFVIVAIALGAYAVYAIKKRSEMTTDTTTNNNKTENE